MTDVEILAQLAMIERAASEALVILEELMEDREATASLAEWTRLQQLKRLLS